MVGSSGELQEKPGDVADVVGNTVVVLPLLMGARRSNEYDIGIRELMPAMVGVHSYKNYWLLTSVHSSIH